MPTPGSEKREQVARTLLDSAFECLPEKPQLPFAPDQRRVEAAGEGIGAFDHPQQAVRDHRLLLPLRVDRLDRLDLDRVAHQRERSLPDQHLARPRTLLQARGDVHGVSGHERFAASGDHLPAVDADAQLHLADAVT